MPLRALALLTFALLLCSCQPTPAPAPPPTTFYHWQTRLAPDSVARSLLTTHGSDRLYVKAFDVSWTAGRAEPTALIEPQDTAGLPPLVPVVFITNEVFRQTPAQDLKALAEQILGLTEELLGSRFPEFQIDCDWTAGTRAHFFVFLAALRQQLAGRRLSCTVRLHQYRDRAVQGVPPVDRGVLMAYNTGDLNDWATENSIVDTNVVKTYLAGTEPYPLPLDLAVAAYDWAAVYRRDRLAYLINEPDLTELADTARFAPLDGAGLRYAVRRGTYLGGLYLYADDLIRREVAPPAAVPAQLRLLHRYLPPTADQRTIIYRLNSRLWR